MVERGVTHAFLGGIGIGAEKNDDVKDGEARRKLIEIYDRILDEPLEDSKWRKKGDAFQGIYLVKCW